MSGGEGKVFVVSSPSGGGKTTVIKSLLRKMRTLRRSISVTTRSPRPGERNGRDYSFVAPARFLALRKSDSLIEWAKVHGAYYGTPRQPILKSVRTGRDVVLSIDVQGARKIRRVLGKRAVLIFLLPPSMAVLKQRLLARSTETPEALQQRLLAAKRELGCAADYDYKIVNDHVQHAVAQLVAIIKKRGR